MADSSGSDTEITFSFCRDTSGGNVERRTVLSVPETLALPSATDWHGGKPMGTVYQPKGRRAFLVCRWPRRVKKLGTKTFSYDTDDQRDAAMAEAHLWRRIHSAMYKLTRNQIRYRNKGRTIEMQLNGREKRTISFPADKYAKVRNHCWASVRGLPLSSRAKWPVKMDQCRIT